MQLVRESTGADRWSNARNILAVRLDNIGDVLMTTPALRAIKEANPQRSVTLLTSETGAAAACYIPAIDHVLRYDAPWVKSIWQASSLSGLRCLSQITEGRFDAAIVFSVYSQSALPAATITWLAGIPLRLAFVRENPYQLLTDWVKESEPHNEIRHEVRRQLDLVASVGYTTTDDHLSFQVEPQDHAQTMEKLEEAGIDPARPFIVVHPGATAASRRYPAAQFAAAMRLIAARTGDHQFVITGGVEERQLVESVRLHGARGAVGMAGQFALGELAALIQRSVLLIANNTGPVHLAAALGTPVVDLYALTNPQHTPWRVLSRVLFHDVPCKYCYKSVCPEQHQACLRQVTPEAVAQAACELLETIAQRRDNVLPLPQRRLIHTPGGGVHA
ncbi:MAG: glycosyltransferase family 9 protein [Burkholderiales bacterium]|nr:glycosyltransferase family 9 protein [Burkholderiales bacterium]